MKTTEIYKNIIYKTNADNSARYVLGKYNDNPLVFFGINPSTATVNENDNTISIIEKIARKFGYDGYIMLNLCPIRATKISDTFVKTYCEKEMLINLEYIKSVIKTDQNIVAAWGGHITDRNYFLQSLTEINRIVNSINAKWICLSKTKYGHPHHPTRIAYSKMDLIPFDMESYIKVLAQKNTHTTL